MLRVFHDQEIKVKESNPSVTGWQKDFRTDNTQTLHTHTFQDDHKGVSTSDIKKTHAVKDKVFYRISKPLSAATVLKHTHTVNIKMSIYNIAQLSNVDLKKLAIEYISLDDVYYGCEDCGRPVILHWTEKCTQDVEETLEVVDIN